MVLETKPRSSARVAHALHHELLSILPLSGIFVVNKLPFALASPVLWFSWEEGGGHSPSLRCILKNILEKMNSGKLVQT